MNLNAGRSYIKLIIAIVIIIAVLIIGINYVLSIIKRESVKDVQADLLLIQAKVNIVKGNYSVNKEENPLKGYQLNQLPENINIDSFFEKHIIPEEEYEKYYLLDSDVLNQMELQELVNKYQGYFIVNYDNFEVIYTEGYENENGMWCYKLTDLHKKPEIEQKQENNQEQQGQEAQDQSGEENQEQTEENTQEQSAENNQE